MKDWQTWLKGLGSAFIGGGSAAGIGILTSGTAEINWRQAGMTALIAGGVSALMYLKQSPLPGESK